MIAHLKKVLTWVKAHVQRDTLSVEINLPSHEVRGNGSVLFEHTRKQLIERDTGCFICGITEKLEAHHYPIEWSFANAIDFSPGSLIRKDFPDFDWESFDPADPYKFVDDMLVNGLLLCKAHHIEKDTGIHALPHPLWIPQRYCKEGYVFSDKEVIHHVYPK
jgi:hypothetical protein